MDDYHIATKQELERTEALNQGVLLADRFVHKNYLIDLTQYPVMELQEEARNLHHVRLYEMEKLVYDKQENTNDKLISVYSALQEIDSTALLLISGTEEGITCYLGVRAEENVSTASRILEKSFLGNFPGSALKGMKNTETNRILDRIIASDYVNTPRNVSAVTIVPSMRDEDKEKFVQGMEKFIDTMQGETYTAVLLAQPVSKSAMEERKRGFEELYSILSPFLKTSLAYGENDSRAVSNGIFENFSHSVNHSIANTTGRNSSTSSSRTKGYNTGTNGGGGGFGMSSGRSTSQTSGYSAGQSFSKSVTEGTADSTGQGTNRSDTVTKGSSKTLTVEHQNKSIAVLLETIEKQLKRMEACEAFGVWECSGYFIADDIQTSVVAANTYKALMLGDETSVENAFVNVWDIRKPEQTSRVLDSVRYGLHPLIEIPGPAGFDSQFVTPGNFISGKELPLLMGMPQKSVSGLTVSHMAEFGRNVFLQNPDTHPEKIRIGKIHHMGKTEAVPVKLDLQSFTSHCFVTGSTGSGKSNTVYGLLEQFHQKNIPFLVVEPAKGEYKTAFGNLPDIQIYTTNPMIGQMLKLNPFRFDPKIHVLEHLDRLVEIFNACWEMYAAMPAILKDAMEQIYLEKGWDLMNSVYLGEGAVSYPTFLDLLHTLPKVINQSGYSSDTKGDYTGALVTRVASLTKGITGQIFCDLYDIPDETLFDQTVIVDLSRVGSTETKSLIMGMLVLKLTEYRMANAGEANHALRHITVLEEAHNLLKRTSTEQGQSSANLIGKSVEMICNSIAEMRTYGEGFLIVDQSPTAVDISAIKNTNTKILMRLPEKGDCEAVGNAVGLEEDQVKELAKLGTGVAVVMQNNWLEAVLAKIDRFCGTYEREIPTLAYEKIRTARSEVLLEYMTQYVEERQMDPERLCGVIDRQNLTGEKKTEWKSYFSFLCEHLKGKREIGFFCDSLIQFCGCRSLFDMTEGKLVKKKEETEECAYESASMDAWKQVFVEKLGDYVDLSEAFRSCMLQYMVYSKSLEQTTIDYGEVYDALFRKNGF